MSKWLFTGSFDPLTNGHLDIIERAAVLCDELVVGIITNPAKNPLFTSEEKLRMIGKAVEHLKNVSVAEFGGLLVDYYESEGFDCVVRGIRNGTDFDYELQMDYANKSLYPGFESVYLMTSPEVSFISSTNVKEIFLFNGRVDQLVPPAVYEEMINKKNNNTSHKK